MSKHPEFEGLEELFWRCVANNSKNLNSQTNNMTNLMLTQRIRPYLAKCFDKYLNFQQWRIMRFQSHVKWRKRLTLGHKVTWNYGCYINAAKGITIGDNVLIGPYCIIQTVNHCFSDISKPINQQGWDGAPIIIEQDCWLGAHVIVLPGVKIGRGSVIGANSVVAEDIPPYSIAIGSPAKIIRSRKNRFEHIISLA